MAGLLDSLSGALGGIFKGASSSTSVVGLDIGSSAIKAVQLKKEHGRVVLETYGAVSLGPYAKKEIGEVVAPDKEVIAAALKDLFKEANITTGSVAVAVPSASSLVFVLELPKVSEQELKNIVPTEARKYIPVPLDEVSMDWWEMPEQDEDEESKTVKILVVAIRKDSISYLQAIMQEVQLDLQFFEVELFSNIRASLEHELQPIALVDFGASATRVAIIEYGIVRHFQVINRGASSLSHLLTQSMQVSFIKAEDLKKDVGVVRQKNPDETKKYVHETLSSSLGEILGEVQGAILNYERNRNKVVTKVVVVGGGGRMPGLLDFVSRKLNIEVASALPFSKTQNPAFLDEVLDQIGVEFGVAVGLALRGIQ